MTYRQKPVRTKNSLTLDISTDFWVCGLDQEILNGLDLIDEASLIQWTVCVWLSHFVWDFSSALCSPTRGPKLRYCLHWKISVDKELSSQSYTPQTDGCSGNPNTLSVSHTTTSISGFPWIVVKIWGGKLVYKLRKQLKHLLFVNCWAYIGFGHRGHHDHYHWG